MTLLMDIVARTAYRTASLPLIRNSYPQPSSYHHLFGIRLHSVLVSILSYHGSVFSLPVRMYQCHVHTWCDDESPRRSENTRGARRKASEAPQETPTNTCSSGHPGMSWTNQGFHRAPRQMRMTEHYCTLHAHCLAGAAPQHVRPAAVSSVRRSDS